MTASQKLAVRLSEVRQRLNEIGGLEGDAYLEEVRAEETKLQTEYRDTEQRWRSATIAEGDAAAAAGAQFGTRGSVEDRAYRELVGRADVGDVFAAVMEHRATDGAMRELQQHRGLAMNQIPLDMLRLPAVEHRAVTPAPTHVGASEQAVLMPVLADGDAAFLSVDQVTVPNGDAVFPVLTNRPTVGGPHADSTEVTETTGAFSAELVKPERLQAAFTYRRVDAARFSAMGESLRAALNESLSEALDVQIVSGANGLLGGTNLDAHAQASVDTFGTYVSKFGFARVDGRYAPTVKSIKVLMGSAGYAHAGSVYRGDQSQESAVDRLMTIGGGVRVSAHVQAVTSNKQQTIVRLGARRDAVAGLWQGVTIIPDEVTRAKQGEIVITAVMLAAVKILRSGGFYKAEVKVA